MSRKEELGETNKKTSRSSVVQGAISPKEKVKLSFSRLELEIMSETNEAIHELKNLTGFETSRIISFLLDAGTLMFRTVREQMLRKLQEMTDEK